MEKLSTKNKSGVFPKMKKEKATYIGIYIGIRVISRNQLRN